VKATTAVIGLLVAALAGCSPQHVALSLVRPARAPVNYYRAAGLRAERLQRVALAPFEPGPADERAAQTVTQAFSHELAKLGRFEVVFPPTEPGFFLPHTGLKPDGTIDVDALVRARKQLRVDAFLIGTVTAYKAYDPPLLGLKVQLVSATSGEVLWAADSTLDGSEPNVRRLARTYHGQHEDDDTLYGWRAVLVSPTRYARFFCFHILSTLRG